MNRFFKVDQLCVDSELHRFVDTSVLPASPMDSAEFWRAVSRLLEVAKHAIYVNSASKSWSPLPTDLNPTNTVSSTSQPGTTAGFHKSWQNEETTPSSLSSGKEHCAEAISFVRHEPGESNSKEFLDKSFPLSEGSHTEAVSYMAYYQNLLVILADGRTTGLRYPKQFIGKKGRSESPDSILLANNDAKARITFDRSIALDPAGVDDIQIENRHLTALDFSAVSVDQKLSTYRNWIDRIRGDGSTRSKGTFSAIASTEFHSGCELLLDDNGIPVPDALIDMIMTAVINAVCSEGCSEIDYYLSDSDRVLPDSFIEQLQRLLIQLNFPSSVNPSNVKINVYRASEFHPSTSGSIH